MFSAFLLNLELDEVFLRAIVSLPNKKKGQGLPTSIAFAQNTFSKSIELIHGEKWRISCASLKALLRSGLYGKK